MNEEFYTESIPVSCMNALKDLPQPDLRYGQCVRQTVPVLFEINEKLDKSLALLDKGR